MYVPCEKCGGDGRIRENKRISLKVPSGAQISLSRVLTLGAHTIHARVMMYITLSGVIFRLFLPPIHTLSCVLMSVSGSSSVSGVDSGSRLRVRGEGNSGRRGGESGDLYVYIAVKDHPELRREGTTIHSDVEISFADAILGTQVRTSCWPCMNTVHVISPLRPEMPALMCCSQYCIIAMRESAHPVLIMCVMRASVDPIDPVPVLMRR